ncbi:MAG: hypothetical protein OSA45_05470 [Halioglobus sp.]|nr:hypothetical protein [Halioglobus sp.]
MSNLIASINRAGRGADAESPVGLTIAKEFNLLKLPSRLEH